MNKEHILIDFIFGIRINWGQILYAVENKHHSSKNAHNDLINYVYILSIHHGIRQCRAFKI